MTAVIRDRTVVAGAVLRVLAAGEVVGAAFLIGPGVAATTAEVLAGAGSDVRLDFPLLQASGPVAATVLGRSPRGVVVLRLTGAVPPGALMPPLRRVAELGGATFSVLGFPEGLADGVWTTGRFATGPGLVTLQGAPGEQPLDSGFAGAPVWESRTGAVVGMAAARPDGAGMQLIPIDEVLGQDPERLPSPYRGLRTFDEAHAGTFFGRDDDIERLLDAVGRLPVVAVAGPSGAGKSSLVRAGLVPRLRALGAEIGYVRAEPGVRLPDPVPAGTVLVIDQFEELAALDPAAARDLLDAVVRRTDPAAGDGVRAVLTLRWTTLDDLLTPELITTLAAGTVLVGPLDRDRLEEAIVGPARQPPGLAFEPGLVETILDDAGAEPGQLPLVESLLTDLWERRDGGFLTMHDYQAAGGVAGALAQHAESVAAAPAADDALRRLLTTLARPGRDGRFVRRPVPLDQLPPAQRALVPALTSGRLLVVSTSARGDEVVEFAHQALVDHWPRLRAWLAADREFLAWREQVEGQRERWEAEERADTVLLRGAPLAAAAEWLPARVEDLPRADVDFVRRSTARQRRDVRRWRIITAVVAVLALGAAALTVVAVTSANQVAAQLAAVNADALGREAQARIPTDPATAGQLALAAWSAGPGNGQARTALAQTAVAMRSVERELPDLTSSPIGDVMRAGDIAVLRAAPHPVLVTGVTGPTPQHRELGDVPGEAQMGLSPDGRWLAHQTADRSALVLRDLTSATSPRTLQGTAGTLAAFPRFSPDSARLAWATVASDQTTLLRIHDLRTGTDVPHGVAPLPTNTSSVSLTPDPEQVLVRRGRAEHSDNSLILYSLLDGRELTTMPGGTRIVLDGAGTATCEQPPDRPFTATVVVTRFDGGAPLRIPITNGNCDSLTTDGPVVSASGDALVERYVAGRARVTDLRTGAAFQVTIPGERDVLALPGMGGMPRFDVLDFGAGGQALTARGSALMWLRGEPVPGATTLPRGARFTALDKDFRVAVTQDGYFTTDLNGNRLGELTGIVDRSTLFSARGKVLWHARPVESGWELTRYELPMLRLLNKLVLPSRTGGRPAGDQGRPPMITFHEQPPEAGGRLVTISDGVLAAWNPETGKAVGPPIPLGSTDRQTGFHRVYPTMAARPNHADEVAVLGINDVQIWNVLSGKLVTTVPAVALLDPAFKQRQPIAFDPAGNRLAVLARDHTLQVWDVATTSPTRPPTPAPTMSELLGFDVDGYLVALATEGSRSRVVFLDAASGAEVGALGEELTRLTEVGMTDDRTRLQLQSLLEAWAVELPLSAGGWRDRLCTAVGRPFTAAEQALLPPGTSTDPPCS